MAKKYSDAIKIRETKSAYNIQTEEGAEWTNFIPNEQFNGILQKVIGSVSNKIVDEHRSFWMEGTFGTGKSHAAAVIKHLLCDSIEDIEQYIKENTDIFGLDIMAITDHYGNVIGGNGIAAGTKLITTEFIKESFTGKTSYAYTQI